MLDSASRNAGAPPQLPPDPQEPQPMSAPYSFPHDKLKRRLSRADKTPLVLVACGSFSPITFLHLQMFEMTERYVEDTGFEIVGKYLSPVSDAYKQPSLAPAHHRINMCTLAVENTTDIMVDPWETLSCDKARELVYTRTVDALKHFDHEINDVIGLIETADGAYKRTRIALLIGADVAMTMADPNVWAPSDLDQILGVYGAFVVKRPTQTDIHEALDALKQYDRIWVVSSFQNNVSSTKVRDQLRNGENVEDLPDSVIEYIKLHNLYQSAPQQEDKAKTER